MSNRITTPIYIAIAMLTVAMFPMPYGYYVLLRLAVCATMIYVVMNTKNALLWFSVIFAVIYNPIVRFTLDRPVWTCVNVITIVFLIAVLVVWNRARRKLAEGKLMPLGGADARMQSGSSCSVEKGGAVDAENQQHRLPAAQEDAGMLHVVEKSSSAKGLVEKNSAQTVEFYHKAAELGDAQAQFSLGLCYEWGDGVTRDIAEAEKWYKKAAEKGSEEARTRLLSIAMIKDQVTDPDMKYGVLWWQQNAEKGDAKAQYTTGYLLETGFGKVKDLDMAVQWYKKAAEQGFPAAENALGNCCLYGRGVEKDFVEAVKWFQRAAVHGIAAAQGMLGACYYDGKGVPANGEEAVKWLRMAADQQNAPAQTLLGLCYINGKGVEKNMAEGIQWLQKAEGLGDIRAKTTLGTCYFSGNGVERNTAEALIRFKEAAKKGHADAQLFLGTCYANGMGIEKNTADAINWISMAAKQGHSLATKILKELMGTDTQEAVLNHQKHEVSEEEKPTEKTDALKVDQALACLQNKKVSEAEAILRDVCSRCPQHYQYEYMSGAMRFIRFWEQRDFLEYAAANSADKTMVMWIASAYPRACYHLAFLLVEKGDFGGAVQWLIKGQLMEPHNPKFPLELGFIHGHMKQHEISLAYYRQAYNIPNISKQDRAVALRGMGVQLIDLQRFAEAESRLKESLELEPDNGKTKHELMFLALLQNRISQIK